jgi:hypothetical protein
MKKIIFLSIMLAGFFLTSCEKDEIGGTATESLAGEWYVTADAINADGSIWEEDLFGIGHFQIATYNTASNVSNELWVDDVENFWEFKIKTNSDAEALTFSAENADNAYYDSKVTILNGKILLKAATTPSGIPADSIVFEVSFDDDTYPANYGYSRYRISGYRYTGFTADE